LEGKGPGEKGKKKKSEKQKRVSRKRVQKEGQRKVKGYPKGVWGETTTYVK